MATTQEALNRSTNVTAADANIGQIMARGICLANNMSAGDALTSGVICIVPGDNNRSGIRLGVSGKAERIGGAFIGVNGVAKKIKKGLIGVPESPPAGYTPLQYVVSNGSQRVALSLNFSSQFRLEHDFECVGAISTGYMLGYRATSGGTNYITGARMVGGDNNIKLKGGTQSTSDTGGVIVTTGTVAPDTRYLFGFTYVNNGGSVTYELTPYGGEKTTGSGSSSFTTGNKNLFLLNYYDTESNGFVGRTYGFKGYVNGSQNPYIELEPYRRDSDGVVGFYDTIGNSFYAPTGSLTAGPVKSGYAAKVFYQEPLVLVPIVISGSGRANYVYVTINGTNYTGATSLNIEPGTSIVCHTYGYNAQYPGTITVNDDVKVNITSYSAGSYTFVVPEDATAITISLTNGQQGGGKGAFYYYGTIDIDWS